MYFLVLSSSFVERGGGGDDDDGDDGNDGDKIGDDAKPLITRSVVGTDDDNSNAHCR